MADESDSEDKSVAAAADDIAAKITKILIESFKTKTGREPDNKEIEQLFEELTTERVAELLGEESVSADSNEPGTSSDEEEKGEDEVDNSEDNDEDQRQDDDQKLELNAKEECETSVDLTSTFTKTIAAVEATATPTNSGECEAIRRPFQENTHVDMHDNRDQRSDKRARQ